MYGMVPVSCVVPVPSIIKSGYRMVPRYTIPVPAVPSCGSDQIQNKMTDPDLELTFCIETRNIFKVLPVHFLNTNCKPNSTYCVCSFFQKRRNERKTKAVPYRRYGRYIPVPTPTLKIPFQSK